MPQRGRLFGGPMCPECGTRHESPCPSPEEIWGRRGADGAMHGGLVHTARAMAGRRCVEPDAVLAAAADERLVMTDEMGLPTVD